MYSDLAPRWTIDETDYGLALTAQRNANSDRYQYRVTQHLFPFVNLIAVPQGERMLANVRVPIDDESSIFFRIFVHPDRPLDDDDRSAIGGGVIVPEIIPGTFLAVENLQNDYLIDREAQRTKTFTGIKSIPAQDLAVAQDQGGFIADRSRERLVSSDRAIIAARKKFLTRVKQLVAGEEPPEATKPRAYAVRAVDFYLPRNVAVAEGAKELLVAGVR